MRLAITVDQRVRDMLRRKFPDSLSKAFESMDARGDRRLSADDLMEGLNRLDPALDITREEAAALVARVDTDGEGQIGFEEFVVRFGLDFKAEGRWEYKPAGQETESANKDPEEVKAFRREMPASKWFGRGGVQRTLQRHVTVAREKVPPCPRREWHHVAFLRLLPPTPPPLLLPLPVSLLCCAMNVHSPSGWEAPPPSPCTNWTRLVLPPVLSGHVSSFPLRMGSACTTSRSRSSRRRCATGSGWGRSPARRSRCFPASRIAARGARPHPPPSLPLPFHVLSSTGETRGASPRGDEGRARPPKKLCYC